MKAKNLLLSVAAGLLSLTICGTPAIAQDAKPADTKHAEKEHKKDKEVKKDEKHHADDHATVGVGSTAPDFKAKDSEGKEHSLAELTKSGKIVVLQWFNPECPWVQKHYTGTTKTFNELNTKYKDKGVVLLAVASNAPGNMGSGADRMNKAIKDWNIAYPILVDESGTIGKSYGAKVTPTMVVIGKDGKIAYMGAIDDANDDQKPGKTNYVAKALDEVLSGSSVTTPSTKAKGCGIKYKDKN